MSAVKKMRTDTVPTKFLNSLLSQAGNFAFPESHE